MKAFICKMLTMIVVVVGSVSVMASVSTGPIKKIEGVEYSPKVADKYPTRVYWGDTHLHTMNSPDANLAGNLSLTPADAYRFAKGEPVKAMNGMTAQLTRPLDFLVVTDHAEYLGFLPMIRKGDKEILKTEYAKWLSDMLNGGQEKAIQAAMDLIFSMGRNEEKIKAPDISMTAWKASAKAADDANQPGVFTAFIGYEWTSMPNNGDNLHRVVVFREGSEMATKILPFSAFNSENPEDLWQFLEDYERNVGGKVLAIPHNGNLSNGRMFQKVNYSGKPMTKEYVETRIRWEPLVETTQIKGDSETHPTLSPDDEFAGYELWDKSNLTGNTAKTDDMLQYEYSRSALKIGLQLEEKLGTNPYKFGMIGSTDAHTSLPSADSNNFWGKVSVMEPSPERYAKTLIVPEDKAKERTTYGYDMAASGYAAVWATDNTREAIFEAMQRKETYATTGPRMVVRFFGGWTFKLGDETDSNLTKIGYTKGVPMGSDLTSGPADSAPTFLIHAVKDPDGANLDRVQIIKGWLDKSGKTHELVYNVALSDDRKPGANGKVKPVGSTVDVKNASYKNTIGDGVLATVWTHPDFDEKQKAFYYVRVIQIPTPRWTAYDAKTFNINTPDDIEMTTQERAYTSPIWYSP